MTEPQGPPGTEIILYQTADQRTRVEVRVSGGTAWLTQAQMAELYQTSVQNVNAHLIDIYEEGELDEQATINSWLIVRNEGTREVGRSIQHYNLDAVLAVGYRVRSSRGTLFRQWATARLAEYLVKGFALDDERLRDPPGAGVPDYFDELLERIRDIRASERRMYLRVRDIIALAADYAPSAAETARVFQTVQNKLHFASTGKTAAELIVERADHALPNMGLTSWKGDVVRKGDVVIAKNYLREDEIDGLNRIVVMFLDFAEDQAKRRKQIFLRDWSQRLDDFLRFNDRNVLPNAGAVSHDEAEQHASGEYDRFNERRRVEADQDAERRHLEEISEVIRSLPRAPKETGQ
ncbi:MAG: virulence RhuM family protein [Gemmatimonadota bacterium]